MSKCKISARENYDHYWNTKEHSGHCVVIIFETLTLIRLGFLRVVFSGGSGGRGQEELL